MTTPTEARVELDVVSMLHTERYKQNFHKHFCK